MKKIILIVMTIVVIVLLSVVYYVSRRHIVVKSMFTKGMTSTEFTKQEKESKHVYITPKEIFSNKNTMQYNGVIDNFNSVNSNILNIVKSAYTVKPGSKYDLVHGILSYNNVLVSRIGGKNIVSGLTIKYTDPVSITERFTIPYIETNIGGGMDIGNLDLLVKSITKVGIDGNECKKRLSQLYSNSKDNKFTLPTYQVNAATSVQFWAEKDKDGKVTEYMCIYLMLSNK